MGRTCHHIFRADEGRVFSSRILGMDWVGFGSAAGRRRGRSIIDWLP
jgi:hypothetical protein